jgi:hypothetical protein
MRNWRFPESPPRNTGLLDGRHLGFVERDAIVTFASALCADLTGDDAERANHLLCQRYGWQWNIVPLLRSGPTVG